MLCTSAKILLSVAFLSFLFFFLVQVGCVCLCLNLLCLPFSSVRTGCQRQSSLLAEVGWVSHQVPQPLPHTEVPENMGSSELLGSKALTRPQRSRGGQCLFFAAEESATSLGWLIPKNPVMQIIWVFVSKESQGFFLEKIA